VLGATFLVGGLALVGIPPLVGFFGKLLVFDSLARVGSNAGLAVALAGAILTIAYVSRAWNRGFWGDRPPAVAEMRADRGAVAVVATLALAVVAVGVGFDPVVRFADAAADAALGHEEYVAAVLGGDGA
jgi:multicomponent Na+:H+ antiporter subunit D